RRARAATAGRDIHAAGQQFDVERLEWLVRRVVDERDTDDAGQIIIRSGAGGEGLNGPRGGAVPARGCGWWAVGTPPVPVSGGVGLLPSRVSQSTVMPWFGCRPLTVTVNTAAESTPSVTATSSIDTLRPADCAEALGTMPLSKLTAVNDARIVEMPARRARRGKWLMENMIGVLRWFFH